LTQQEGYPSPEVPTGITYFMIQVSMDATARKINNVNEITILHVRSSGPRG